MACSPSALLRAIPVVAIATACVPPPPPRAPLAALEQRAAFDFQCHPSWLQVYRFNASTVGIVGCGRQATYVQHCDTVCAWRLEPSPRPYAPGNTAATQRAYTAPPTLNAPYPPGGPDLGY